MKTKTQIEFGFIDVTAKSDSQLSITDKQDFVDLEDLKQDDIEETKYATLERNQFALDGTFELMPENLDNMCLWSSSMSNDAGIFERPPVLTINFTEPHSSLGLTFLFSKAGDYCSHLNITYYDKDNQLINDSDFYPDDYQYVCNNIVENYQKYHLRVKRKWKVKTVFYEPLTIAHLHSGFQQWSGWVRVTFFE